VLARRLLLLAAVLMLLAALAAGLAPQERADAPSPATSLPNGTTVVEQISAADSDARVVVRRGDVLRLEVAGDTLDSVLIERLDRIEAIEPLTPARFELLADAPAGVYPIRLVEADRRIGSIEITN
jgi:hypothetical protein